VLKQVDTINQAVESLADSVQEFAGEKCRRKFVKRANKNDELPFCTTDQANIDALVAKYANAEAAKAAGYARYYMVRVNIEGVLTTVQAHRGWRSCIESFGQFRGLSAALIEAEREAGYTENHNVFNIVSSKYHDHPREFDDYAGYAEHINSNPDLNTLYSTALEQCKESTKQRSGIGTLVLQCDDFFPGSEHSNGVYTHQFRTITSIKTSELIKAGENQRFVLRYADRQTLGEAIIKAQESQSGRGLELEACIEGKASGFLLFNDLEGAKRKIKSFTKK
jgi:hypothetical protein